MRWQERLRVLGDKLTSGEITTAEYREQSDEVLAEADREAAAETAPSAAPAESGSQDTDKDTDKERLHIPVSAAWEAPSGEMTQLVGMGDHTTVVPTETESASDASDAGTTS